MMAWASAPARKASVTNPARSEWPPSLSTWAGVNPAAVARRWIISLIACPVIAVAPMAPVACTRGNNARAGSAGSWSRAPRQPVLRLVLPLLFSPTGSGLAAEDGHHRPPSVLRVGGIPGLQDLPPPDVGAGRAGGRVPPVGQGLDRAAGLLVRLRPPQPDMQTIGAVQGDVFEGELGEL